MEFRTLERTEADRMADAFNQSFADYEIPMQLTPETLLQKIQAEDIDLSHSVGAFDGEALVGFILFGLGIVEDVPCAWDGGTGVIPSYRGQKLTQGMFRAMLPRFRDAGIRRVLLEVLETNAKARSLYQRLGFRETRKLHAFKGTVTAQGPETPMEATDVPDQEVLSQLGEVLPAWQQMNQRVRNRGRDVSTVIVKREDAPVAYIQYSRAQNRVLQFATAAPYRRQGLATALFWHINQYHPEPLWVVNVDERAEGTIAFLRAIGLEHFISQYEMELTL